MTSDRRTGVRFLHACAEGGRLPPMTGKHDLTGLLVLCLSASELGCGDPRDAQLPLLPQGDRARVVPPLARVPAQAFATVGIRSASGAVTEACPLSVALALGSSCERTTSGDGTCSSLRNGDDALVRCSVRSSADAASVYDIDLLLEHGLLPRLAVVGSMSDTGGLPVTLQVTTLEQDTIDARCAAEAITVRPGVAWFSLGACDANVNGVAASGCEVTLTAGFENCAR